MCIVIDSNTITKVFNRHDVEHHEFRPILKWIVAGNGKMVFGGSQYNNEIKMMPKYFKIVELLKKARKVVQVDNDKVDEAQKEIEARIGSVGDFNDAHIIAIISISGCKLVCSCNKRHFPLMQKQSLYLYKRKRPKIFSGTDCISLINRRNITPCCLPCNDGGRALKDYFNL